MCPQCARKLFRKKIEALRRQHEEALQQAEREQRRRKERLAKGETVDGETAGQASSPPSSEGVYTVKGGKRKTPLEVGEERVADSRRRGSDSRGNYDEENNSKEVSGGGGWEGGGGVPSQQLGDGHELVRQAVAAASAAQGVGGGQSSTVSAANKRGRPSRWGNKVVTQTEGGGFATGEGGMGVGIGVRAGAVGGSTGGDEASRKAWTGELEKDRTAEDEMEDYLSSLLL